jgi:5-methylcytosine-specific restriction endonuclease McrA
MALQSTYGERTINETVLLYRNGQINLEPGFQRRSVWSLRDRQRLVQSIVSEYPLPNIFLYRRSSRGKTIYDVIDGKQRLETILMFMGIGEFRKQRFDVKLELNEDGPDWWDWSEIKKYASEVRNRFECCAIQTVEVSGELSEIVDLFVRINSTGKRLTSGEKRHARFFDSRFLQEADSLVHRYEWYLLNQSILSSAQIDRMKGTELFSELLMSICQCGLINKKTALDRGIGNDSVNGNTLNRVVGEFTHTMNVIKKMFPTLKQTRLSNSAEFYSLFMFLWQMDREGMVLTDRRRNRMAFELIRRLSTGVDELRDQYRQAKAAKPRPPYSDYLLTVQGDTDSAATRERRQIILNGLLKPIFERKDAKRIFSSEQRRILWNTDTKRKCSSCHRNLTWDDFTVDHVFAHVRGGKTRLENAQLMCRSCNSRKGGR